MLDFPRWKQVWLWFLTLACAVATLPTIFAATGQAWPAVLPAPVINLGLDLAGGSQILLEADPRQVTRLRIENREENVRSGLRNAEPRIAIGEISNRDGALSFLLEDPWLRLSALREAIRPVFTSAAGGFTDRIRTAA